MAEKLKAIGIKLEKAAAGTLLLLCICIFCGLTYYSAGYTVIEDAGIPSDTRDNMWLNLLVLAVVTAAAFLLHGISRSGHLRQARRRISACKPYLIGIVSAYVYVVSVVWITNCHVEPSGDGAVLCAAAHRMITGNYVDMKVPGYMVIFPHQFGLLSLIHLLFTLFGVWNFSVFQHINALCMPLLFYSGYKLLQLICKDFEIVFYYVLFFLGCVPLFLYVPYVYGEIISITFTMVLMWQTLRYCKTGRKSCFFWGTAAIVLACLVRKNSLIVLIAAAIVLAVHAIKEANPRGVIWVLVMALTVSGSGKLIHTYYEKQSGLEVSGGVPYISWIRMGLQDTWAGPGWFDNSSVEAYAEHGYDTEQTALAERERLAGILKDMWRNKAQSVDFFRRKILSQWNSPGNSYVYETKNFDCGPGELPDFVRRVYYDNERAVQAYMNRYQSVLYFFTAVSAAALLADRKKKRCLEEYLPYIAIVGGFLFSMLWEASSRYVLPYVAYMIPLAAAGVYRLAKISDGRGLFRRNKEAVPQDKIANSSNN